MTGEVRGVLQLIRRALVTFRQWFDSDYFPDGAQAERERPVVLLHGTHFINSMAHVFGGRRFHTGDDSRNNFLLALITLGEGWHNNHHRFMGAARQGFYWWEVAPTWYALKALSWTGLIWDLKPVPQSVYAEAEANADARAQRPRARAA